MGDKAYCGVITVQGKGTNTHEMTYKNNTYDKQTGSYSRASAKESFSGGEYRNHRKVGYKNEYKTSSTVRIGDKSGYIAYIEYSKQEKVTRVDYYGSGSSGLQGKISGSGKNYLN